MPTWIIEPRDPLIARDGRPFGPQPGARAASLAFPFPSTIAGGVRTRAGLDSSGIFTMRPHDARQIAIRGPLLVELDEAGAIIQWLAPAPADALLLESSRGEDVVMRNRLVPLDPGADAITDVPVDLALLGMTQFNPSKPHPRPPRFWHWWAFEQWLSSPPMVDEQRLADLGHDGPLSEQRMHVSIQHETQTTEEGALFQTRGLEFTGNSRIGDGFSDARRLALAVACATDIIEPGLAPLGGERRIVAWRQSTANLPACPSVLRSAVIASKHCRVILLTPAYFTQGAMPTWLLTSASGVQIELKALAVQRPQVVSGWDLEKDKPKPTRRLVPAGSVLFLALHGDEQAIGAWIDDSVWMQCISDDDQTRRDGFGLAVPGTWDGQLQQMRWGRQ